MLSINPKQSPTCRSLHSRSCFGTLIFCLLLSQVAPFASLNRKRMIPAAHISSSHSMASAGGDDDISLEAFQARKRQQEERQLDQEEKDFDGYAFRDTILAKWGRCYDVDFNRVDSFGFRSLYLNVLPFHLGGRRFRHETELDYLCHLQAVVEILEKYDQLGYVIAQIAETNKKPRAGTSPLKAVPLRLDLSREEVEEIMGY